MECRSPECEIGFEQRQAVACNISLWLPEGGVDEHLVVFSAALGGPEVQLAVGVSMRELIVATDSDIDCIQAELLEYVLGEPCPLGARLPVSEGRYDAAQVHEAQLLQIACQNQNAEVIRVLVGIDKQEQRHRVLWAGIEQQRDNLRLTRGKHDLPVGIRRTDRWSRLPGTGGENECGGQVFGAVGVSGAPSGEIDENCATAGVAAIGDDLEMGDF